MLLWGISTGHASELLQEAVRAEVHRRELLSETDAYLAEVAAEAGDPTAADRAWAEAIVGRITAHRTAAAS